MEELSKELLSRLDLLAGKLGVTTEYIWGILVKQGYVQGAYGILALITGVSLPFLFIKYHNKLNDFLDRTDAEFAKMMIGAAILLACPLLVCMGLDFMRYLFVPEYYAIKEIGKIIN